MTHGPESSSKVSPYTGIGPWMALPSGRLNDEIRRGHSSHGHRSFLPHFLSAPKSQRFLRFAIAMPIADPRNRAISETRDSNDALRFKGAMESC